MPGAGSHGKKGGLASRELDFPSLCKTVSFASRVLDDACWSDWRAVRGVRILCFAGGYKICDGRRSKLVAGCLDLSIWHLPAPPGTSWRHAACTWS